MYRRVFLGAVALGRPADVRLARRWIADGARPEPGLLVDSDDLTEALTEVPA